MSDASEVKQKDIHVHHQSGKAFILVELHDRIVAELKAEVARQAKVIEKLRERISEWVSQSHPDDENMRTMCLMVEDRIYKEFADIEQGDGT